MQLKITSLLLGALCLFSSCTINTRGGPPRIQGDGIIDGHLALGIAAEDRIIHADLFDGRSDGALFELVIWKLLRIELGLAGASLSLGPLHLGLGVLAYDPEVPRMRSARQRRAHPQLDRHDDEHELEDDEEFSVDGCPECAAALGKEKR